MEDNLYGFLNKFKHIKRKILEEIINRMMLLNTSIGSIQMIEKSWDV